MATYGLTPNGLRIKRLEDILFELELAFKAEFGEEINVDPETSVLGKYIGAFAEREALLWELLKAVYDAAYPDSATGASLDNVAALTAIERLPATYSTVVATCAGIAGTTIPVGRIVSVTGTRAKFKTTASAVIGISGEVDVPFEAVDLGAVQAPAGSLSIIETPVSGWNSVSNDEDAALGREIESDLELRTRRRNSLRVIGAATIEAIRARLLDEVAGVTDALVYENDTDSTDGEGRPPHSIQAIVDGGDSVEIAQKLFDLKAAGIRTFGTDESETIVDSQGFEHVIEFDRATRVRVFVHIRITTGAVFNLGAKQKQKVTVATNTVGETLTLTINGRDFPITTAATKALTVTALVAAIQGGGADWVPVTATQVNPSDDFLYLEADYSGNPFTLAWSTSGATSLTISSVTLSAGDQAGVIADVIEFAEGDEDTVKEQKIGRSVFRSRYFGPINQTPDIETIEIYLASGLESGDYWPTTAPIGGGDWTAADLILAAQEIAEFDSTRVTVEVLP